MLSDHCLSRLSCLSVTLVYCGQTVGRIKMKLGIEVGLGPGHTVLDGDSAPPPPKGHNPHPIFGPYLLRPNGCMDQYATWYRGRPQPRGLCVRWGASPPSPKRGRSSLPQISAHVYCGQTAGWIKMALGMQVGFSPGDFALDGDPAHSPKKGRSPPLQFRPIFIVAKWLDASGCHLVWR